MRNSPNCAQPLRITKKKQLVPISSFKRNNTYISKQKINNVDRNKFRSLYYAELLINASRYLRSKNHDTRISKSCDQPVGGSNYPFFTIRTKKTTLA